MEVLQNIIIGILILTQVTHLLLFHLPGKTGKKGG